MFAGDQVLYDHRHQAVEDLVREGHDAKHKCCRLEMVADEVVDEGDVADEEAAPGHPVHGRAEEDAHGGEEGSLAIV